MDAVPLHPWLLCLGLQLLMQPQMILSFKPLCLHFLCAGITGVVHQLGFMWYWELRPGLHEC